MFPLWLQDTISYGFGHRMVLIRNNLCGEVGWERQQQLLPEFSKTLFELLQLHAGGLQGQQDDSECSCFPLDMFLLLNQSTSMYCLKPPRYCTLQFHGNHLMREIKKLLRTQLLWWFKISMIQFMVVKRLSRGLLDSSEVTVVHWVGSFSN